MTQAEQIPDNLKLRVEKLVERRNELYNSVFTANIDLIRTIDESLVRLPTLSPENALGLVEALEKLIDRVPKFALEP